VIVLPAGINAGDKGCRMRTLQRQCSNLQYSHV
jgi:hypothetical protein